MRIKCLKPLRFVFLLILLQVASLAQSTGKQQIGKGMSVFFGQSLAEVEIVTGVKAEDVVGPIARKGIDKIISLNHVKLEFDTDRLHSIEFQGDYELPGPLSPFRENWKNLIPIGGKELRAKMTREDVLVYLKKWEDGVRALGYRRKDSGELGEKEYAITDTDEEFLCQRSVKRDRVGSKMVPFG